MTSVLTNVDTSKAPCTLEFTSPAGKAFEMQKESPASIVRRTNSLAPCKVYRSGEIRRSWLERNGYFRLGSDINSCFEDEMCPQ